MTAPDSGGVPPAPGDGPRKRPWVLRPSVALPIVGAVIVLVALLTPEPQGGGRAGDSRLSSFSSTSQGARALHDLARRLGWQVERRLTDSMSLGDSGVVHMVLDPPRELSPGETHRLLESVRRGAGLVYIIGGGALNDSLGVQPAGSGVLARPDTGDCPPGTGGILAAGIPFWPDGQVHLFGLRWTGAEPPGRTTLAKIRVGESLRRQREVATVVGFPLERGRVVVAADPDIVRNDVMRVCEWGTDLAAVRMLEYASENAGGAPRQRLVFDEYHQGYGDRPGTLRGIARYLGRTSSGHLMLQLAGAGLVLVFALGARALPPRAVERIERRSPLEHVDALARAYQQVGATRTATARLLHGVRRRVEHGDAAGGVGPSRTDDTFLGWALARAPERAADVEVIRRALGADAERRDLEAVGAALRRLESSLTTLPR